MIAKTKISLNLLLGEYNINIKDDNDSQKETEQVLYNEEVSPNISPKANKVIGPTSPNNDEEIKPNTSPNTNANSKTDTHSDTSKIIKNQQNLDIYFNNLHKCIKGDNNSSQKLILTEGYIVANNGVSSSSIIQNKVIVDDQNILQKG